MTDLAAIFLGGVLGSAHCVGMCGGLAAVCSGPGRGKTTAGNGPGAAGPRASVRNSTLSRSVLFSLGRVFTYAFLGMLAGRLGMSVAGLPVGVVVTQRAVSVVAGVSLVLVGVAAMGLWRPSGRWAMSLPMAGALGAGLLAAQRQAAVRPGRFAPNAASFLGGVCTGFLPCGLVYAFLALAASRASVLEAAAVMVSFGMGTWPLMIVSGWGGRWLAPALRARVHTVAAGVVVLLGLVTIARGLSAG